MREPDAHESASQDRLSGPGSWEPARARDVRTIPGHVDVWLAWCHALTDRRALELVPDEDRRWLDTIMATPAREQRLHARAALRAILSGYLRVPARRVELTRDERGKPRLRGGALEISLSHTGGCSLIAVSATRSVGVDIERCRPTPVRALHRFLSHADQQVLERAEPTERDRVALGLWTRKEAVAKATGQSVGALTTLTLGGAGVDRPARVAVGAATVAVQPLGPDCRFVASLARLGPDRGTRCRTWVP